MESKVLEREAGVKVSSKQGPPSGRGTTFTVTYVVYKENAQAASIPKAEERKVSDEEALRLWEALGGIGKEMYAQYGGGEAWLKQERADDYSPFKRKKMR
jgi:hypothetical protein